jgi:hypothetical protein
MNLLVNALKAQIAELARAKGVARPRVLDKVNARGEVVIALILPNEAAEPEVRPSREEIKRARER